MQRITFIRSTVKYMPNPTDSPHIFILYVLYIITYNLLLIIYYNVDDYGSPTKLAARGITPKHVLSQPPRFTATLIFFLERAFPFLLLIALYLWQMYFSLGNVKLV